MGIYSNKHRADGRQLGTVSAVLYHHGRDWRHTEKVLGETVMEADMTLCALNMALDLLTVFLTSHQPADPLKVTITSPSNFAITKVLSAAPHEEQNITIGCLGKLGELMTAFPQVSIQLLWLPRSTPFVGFKRAKQLALEAIHTADPNPDDKPHTIKHQKKKTKEAAVTTWANRWHDLPRTSLAYRTALTKPPDGRTHPTFQQNCNTAKFSRKTLCTLYRLTTGHAFIGSYTQRFYSLHTPDQIACPCSEPVQTVEHLLLKCPTYTAARHKHLTANGRPHNLSQLFNHPKHVTALLRFLEETGASSKPRTEWEPG
jgi:hypothetical protein